MRCPMCLDVELDERFSQGIEIDVCPNCKGVWLDHGELHELVQRARPAPSTHDRGVSDGPVVLASSGPAVSDGAHVESGPSASKKKKKSNKTAESAKSKKSKKKKKSKAARWGSMLEDVLDDVLDF